MMYVPTRVYTTAQAQTSSGTPISGVQVSFAGGQTMTTGSNGQAQVMTYNGGTSVTSASKSGYTFTIANTSGNYYLITGTPTQTSVYTTAQVQTGSGTALSGVAVTFGNGTTVTTGSNGQAQVMTYNTGTTVTSASKSGYTFTIANTSGNNYLVTGTATATNSTPSTNTTTTNSNNTGTPTAAQDAQLEQDTIQAATTMVSGAKSALAAYVQTLNYTKTPATESLSTVYSQLNSALTNFTNDINNIVIPQ